MTHDKTQPARPPEYADRRKANLEQKKAVTGQISQTCRYICFGLLVFFYSLQTAKSDEPAHAFFFKAHTMLTLMAAIAALAVIADYLQYFFGSKAVNKALRSDDQLYAPNWLSYRLRQACFEAKQYLTIAAALIVLIVVATSLL